MKFPLSTRNTPWPANAGVASIATALIATTARAWAITSNISHAGEVSDAISNRTLDQRGLLLFSGLLFSLGVRKRRV